MHEYKSEEIHIPHLMQRSTFSPTSDQLSRGKSEALMTARHASRQLPARRPLRAHPAQPAAHVPPARPAQPASPATQMIVHPSVQKLVQKQQTR